MIILGISACAANRPTPAYVAFAMRAVAREGAAVRVDLEAALAAHTGSPYLDGRMFYDPCPLAAEGAS